MRTPLLGAALAALACSLAPAPAAAQYNTTAGRSAPRTRVAVPMAQADGTVVVRTVERAPEADRYGNARGNTYDLAVDGAFDGQTIAVLHFYTGGGFDFSLPRAALREKGFSVYRWSNDAPSPEALRAGLAQANQLWVISDQQRHLDERHLRVIQDFFERGHGVYIWGDNAPYYADANAVAERLLGTTMSGDTHGDTVVGLQRNGAGPGVLQDHLLTTGLEQLYEGITIATVRPTASLRPFLYGSAGNLVGAYYDQGGRRAIIDGGFTRLYNRWDTAGTARYVKNAASWLANAERFGAAVLAPGLRPGATIAPVRTLGPVVVPAVAPPSTHAPPSPPRDDRRKTGLVAMALGALALIVTRGKR